MSSPVFSPDASKDKDLGAAATAGKGADATKTSQSSQGASSGSSSSAQAAQGTGTLNGQGADLTPKVVIRQATEDDALDDSAGSGDMQGNEGN